MDGECALVVNTSKSQHDVVTGRNEFPSTQ